MEGPARRQVVVGIDDFEGSRPALAYAVHLALLHHSPLEIVRICESEADEQHARESVGAAVNHAERVIRGAVPVRGRTGCGTAVGGLVDASATAAVVVVGHRRPEAGSSVAVDVAQRSQAPVVIVPPVWAPAGRTRDVTVAVAAPDHSRRLVEQAFRAAALEGGELTVLHVWHPHDLRDAALARIAGPGWEPREECDRRDRLEALVSTVAADFPGVRHGVELDPALAPAADELAEASEWSVLVVVGRREATDGVADGGEGPLLRSLVDRALCPVLVVPTAPAAPAGARGAAGLVSAGP